MTCDNNNQIFIQLFRVPTAEILDEMKYRLLTGYKRDFKDITNEDLLIYLFTMRKEDFKERQVG